jgi:uncharacterized iron-regulated membrane protein
MLRKTLFWMHLIAGVSAGIVVLIMSVTGVALTYQKQMTEWADRAYWPPAAPPDTRMLTVAELVDSVRTAHPGAPPTSIRFYSDPEVPAVVSIPGGSVWINRYTGATSTGQSQSMRGFFRVMTDWHRWLADDSRSWGRAITGASNLAFLFIVLSGMYLWIPRRWSTHSLGAITWFRGGLGGKARDFNWHNVFGFWTALPLVLVVASGVVISYPWATNLIYTFTGTEAPVRAGGGPGGPARRGPGGESEPELALGRADMLLERIGEHVPGWRTASFDLPTSADRDVSFSIDTSFGGMPQARSTLLLDRHTGQVTAMSTFADQNAGQRARSWMRFVHTGEYYGFPGQTIAGVASLAGVFLVYTGAALSLRRFLAWLARRRRAGTGEAATTD